MSILSRRSDGAVSAVWRLLLRLTLIGIGVFACYRLRNIITTLFVAAIVAYVLDPLVEWLGNRKSFVRLHSHLAFLWTRMHLGVRAAVSRRSIPARARQELKRHAVRGIATLYVFVFAIFALWQGGKLIATPFAHEFHRATSKRGIANLQKKLTEKLAFYDTQAPEWVRSDKIRAAIQKSDFSQRAQKLVSEAGASVFDSLKNIVEIVLLPVLAFYFLIDGRSLKHEFLALVPRPRIREAARVVRDFNRIMRDFVAAQFLLCLIAGVVVGIGLAALHVRFPFVLGVLGGVTRAIPIIGPIIGGIPILLLTLVDRGPAAALAVLGFFTLLHLVESKFLMPLLIGDRMKLHPVIIIVVLLVGGETGHLLLGGQIGALLGMFFAAPIAALTRLLVRRYWLHLRPGAARNSDRPLLISEPEKKSLFLSERID